MPTAAIATSAEPMRYTGKGRSEPSSDCSFRSRSDLIHGGSSSFVVCSGNSEAIACTASDRMAPCRSGVTILEQAVGEGGDVSLH